MIEIVKRAAQQVSRTAIVDRTGTYTYGDLLARSGGIAEFLAPDHRVCMLISSSFAYVATQWGVWRSGSIAVPLCVTHPLPELQHVIQDSDPRWVIFEPKYSNLVSELKNIFPKIEFLSTDHFSNKTSDFRDPDFSSDRRAMILYTSGTTGKPKGVVTTHAQIQAQIESLTQAWEWTSEDRTLNVLPIHHLHGVINILACALWSGASVELWPSFEVEKAWNRILKKDLTLFMAVPTIYAKLVEKFKEVPAAEQKKFHEACRVMRLMVSGSAALPVTLFRDWKEISGHDLLERYGMTEIGMALSNPLKGQRIPGTVGKPLCEVRIVEGEIQVRGPNVFLEYWRKPSDTQKCFHEGWFKTGDIGEVGPNGYYRIMGRNSVDIIKTGGYKVSALEIENVLREADGIQDCAVVGVADSEWGEKVAVAFISEKDISTEKLKSWALDRLAKYKVPTLWKRIDQFPRNAMGKVLKPEVKKLFS